MARISKVVIEKEYKLSAICRYIFKSALEDNLLFCCWYIECLQIHLWAHVYIQVLFLLTSKKKLFCILQNNCKKCSKLFFNKIIQTLKYAYKRIKSIKCIFPCNSYATSYLNHSMSYSYAPNNIGLHWSFQKFLEKKSFLCEFHQQYS